jgi:hypothetical protein
MRATVFTRIAFVGLLLTLLLDVPAGAWNALGHKVVAEIAWRQLAPERRQEIVDTLRRHPRFDADFIRRMPDDVLSADKSIQDRWLFQAAAYWPDVARGGPYDRPWWHFINLLLFVDPADEVLRPELTFNQSFEYPPPGDLENMNVVQAIAYAKETIANHSAAPADKALAYCRLFHLVGDIHQPLHSVSLVS